MIVAEHLSGILQQVKADVGSMAMTLGGVLTLIRDFAGVVALVGTGFVVLGFSFNPPWPTHEEFKETRHIIETVQAQQAIQITNAERQNCFILQLLKDRYLKEQSDAQLELNKTPTSPTLQRARDEAKAEVDFLDSEQRTARCHHLQAPTSSSTAPAGMPGQWIMDPTPRLTRPKPQRSTLRL